MPARTNKLQAVVFYVKEHVAPEGAEVTESKMLVDRDSGKLREVDVVVEHIVGDDPITISVEVIAWCRKASVTWVEQMLSKHQRMPTNRLVLVSWSGFSGTALDKVAQQGGHVEALVPVRLDHDDPTIRFLAPELTLQAAKTPVDTVVIETWCESAGTERLQLPPNAAVFSAETDVEIATFDEVVNRALMAKTDDVSRQAWEAHQRREPRDSYLLDCDAAEMGLDVEVDNVRLNVRRILIQGLVDVERQTLDFEYWSLGPTVFAMTESALHREAVVWVATKSADAPARISWRRVD